MRRRDLLAILGSAAIFSPFAARGQAAPYPSRPIHLIVPYSTGNTIDFAARLLATKLAASLGQPVIVENRTGVSGNIGAEYVSKAPPDGYTVLFTGAQITALPSVMGARAVDPLKDLAPVTRLAEAPLLIVANPRFGVNSLPELIARARAEPGRIAYASTGIGALTHLAAELLFQEAGVRLLNVPYTQSSEAIKDLLMGEVQISFSFIGNVDSLLRSHQLEPLAVTSKARLADWPEIPTVAEQGFPGYAVTSWYSFFVPYATPPDIILRLYHELVRAVGDAAIRDKLVGWGNTIVGNTPAQFAAEVKTWVNRWPPIVKRAGIHIQ
ncbi:MAG: Bug family tripartite tricarboxylate transporter substrate binding protein [Casimicrobiaceae bacterium]